MCRPWKESFEIISNPEVTPFFPEVGGIYNVSETRHLETEGTGKETTCMAVLRGELEFLRFQPRLKQLEELQTYGVNTVC